MGNQDAHQPSAKEVGEPLKQPFKLELGPFKTEGPFGTVGALVLGVLFGMVFAFYVVYQFQQPSVVLRPGSNKAIKVPAFAVNVTDAKTTSPILPADRQRTLQGGQRVVIEISPASTNEISPASTNKYSWTFIPERLFACEPANPIGPKASCQAPEREIEVALLNICELDTALRCTEEQSILFRIAPSQN